MAERPRRARRQVSDSTGGFDSSEEESEEDQEPRRGAGVRRNGRPEPNRLRRSSDGNTGIRVTSTSSDPSKPSVKLTMKMPPSKLREVMRASELDSLKDTLGGGTVLNGPRSRKSQGSSRSPRSRGSDRLKYIEQYSDDEDGAEADEDDIDDDVEEDTTMQDIAESEADNDDIDMEDTPSLLNTQRAPAQPIPPKIRIKPGPIKPKLTVTPASIGPVQSVEDQEMQDEELGEEESESSGDEEEEEDEEEDEDEEEEDEPEDENDVGGEIEAENQDELDEDDEEGDSIASGSATPDPTKLTARQRGKALEPLMSLDMAPQQRKFFTDAEKAMKKDEHARKRKELTKRKVNEEKTAALNRLLKPQVSKTRGAAPGPDKVAAQLEAAVEEVSEPERANPLYTRWISTKDGIQLGVPEEWLGKRIGSYFGPPLPVKTGVLVQELN